MPETLKRDIKLDWACRILVIGDMFVILSGYFAWFQAKWQLVSPLIPRSTVYQIYSESGDMHFRTSIIAGLIFLVGILLYTFKKRIPAIILFSAVIVLFFTMDLFV